MRKWFVALALALGLAVPAVAQQPRTYIHAGRLLADPGTGLVLANHTIVVEDGRVLIEVPDGPLEISEQ